MHRSSHSNRVFGIALGLLVPGLVVGAFSLAQDAPKPETSGQKFKNIKVLKDLPADQLIPVMQKWNAALGVKCNFCHVQDRSADDKPEKGAARAMVTMTMDINKNHKVLEGKATCFMCHHGQAAPQTTPEAPKPVEPPKTGN